MITVILRNIRKQRNFNKILDFLLKIYKYSINLYKIMAERGKSLP